jgi:hypothetical protein
MKPPVLLTYEEIYSLLLVPEHDESVLELPAEWNEDVTEDTTLCCVLLGMEGV